MASKYRIVRGTFPKKTLKPGAYKPYIDSDYYRENATCFSVERRAWWGMWVLRKTFDTQREAEEFCENDAQGKCVPNGLVVAEYEYKE